VLLYPTQSETSHALLQTMLQLIAKRNVQWKDIIKRIVELVQKESGTRFGQKVDTDSDDSSSLDRSVSMDQFDFESAKMNHLDFSKVKGLVDDIQHEIIDVLEGELHQKLALALSKEQKGLIF
jgi:tetrahydromethanopterin S-methyltransferase subunit G